MMDSNTYLLAALCLEARQQERPAYRSHLAARSRLVLELTDRLGQLTHRAQRG